ncbi:MAG: hypothetical protein ACQEP5_10235 [Actinomycetota bacterium]
MGTKTKNILLSFINLAMYAGVVAVNALATILPINNKTTGQLSDQYPNLFVPAGLTFSIWGLIYILLGIFIVYQVVAAFRNRQQDRSLFEKIGILFILSSIFNMAWIFAWHYEVVWASLIIMLLLLLSLISIYLRLNVGKSKAVASEKYMVHLPFSVYLGWITIATIANVTALLVDIGWRRFGLSEQFWTVAVIAVGIIITLGILFTRNDIFYSLVVVWALLGIMLKRLADTATADLSVTIAAIAGMAVIGLVIIVQLIRKKRAY